MHEVIETGSELDPLKVSCPDSDQTRGREVGQDSGQTMFCVVYARVSWCV